MNLIPKRRFEGNPTDFGSQTQRSITEFERLNIGTAQIKDASITTAKIGLLAVENANIANATILDAKISTCSITKLTAGDLTVTGTITTGGFTTGANGVSIKSTGINIWGVGNALTTRATEAGTIQCYVGSDGAIYAGAGAVWLGATGLTINGSYLFVKYGGTLVGGLYGKPGEVQLAASVGNAASVIGNIACYIGATGAVLDFTNDLIKPDTNGDIKLGDATHRFNGMYGNPVLDPTSAAVEGGLSSSGAANGILYVYASGAWRINNVS